MFYESSTYAQKPHTPVSYKIWVHWKLLPHIRGLKCMKKTQLSQALTTECISKCTLKTLLSVSNFSLESEASLLFLVNILKSSKQCQINKKHNKQGDMFLRIHSTLYLFKVVDMLKWTVRICKFLSFMFSQRSYQQSQLCFQGCNRWKQLEPDLQMTRARESHPEWLQQPRSGTSPPLLYCTTNTDICSLCKDPRLLKSFCP